MQCFLKLKWGQLGEGLVEGYEHMEERGRGPEMLKNKLPLAVGPKCEKATNSNGKTIKKKSN